MDYQKPNRERAGENPAETIAALTKAADELIAHLPPEEVSPLVSGDVVAHIIMLMADSRPHSPQEIQQMQHSAMARGGRPMRMTEIELALDLAERLLLKDSVRVTWVKETEDGQSQYKFETPYTDEATMKLLDALQNMQGPIAAEVFEDVFGPGLSILFERGPRLSVKAIGSLLRYKYHFPNFLIEPFIYACQEANLLSLDRRGHTVVLTAASTEGIVSVPEEPVEIKAKTLQAPATRTRKARSRPGLASSVERTSTDQALPNLAKIYEKLWQENPSCELAVIATKRLVWRSAAEKGVPINALLHWMDAEGVNESLKWQVLHALQEKRVIVIKSTEKGDMAMLSEDMQGVEWSSVENRVRAGFSKK